MGLTKQPGFVTKNISKGQLEDQISKRFMQFEREFLGRGPINVKTDIIRDMILVRLEGVLTRAEIELAKDLDGILIVKSMRSKLLENGRQYLEKIISEVTGCHITSSTFAVTSSQSFLEKRG